MRNRNLFDMYLKWDFNIWLILYIFVSLIHSLNNEKDSNPIIFMIKYLSGLLSDNERLNNGINVQGPYPKKYIKGNKNNIKGGIKNSNEYIDINNPNVNIGMSGSYNLNSNPITVDVKINEDLKKKLDTIDEPEDIEKLNLMLDNCLDLQTEAKNQSQPIIPEWNTLIKDELEAYTQIQLDILESIQEYYIPARNLFPFQAEPFVSVFEACSKEKKRIILKMILVKLMPLLQEAEANPNNYIGGQSTGEMEIDINKGENIIKLNTQIRNELEILN